MSLQAGFRLGPYEIVIPIGAGGSPDRLARFTREAQALAALNHPNIAQIYGVVDLPDDTSSALVWSSSRGKIFYVESHALMAAAVRTVPALAIDPPKRLFDLEHRDLTLRQYDTPTACVSSSCGRSVPRAMALPWSRTGRGSSRDEAIQ